MKKKVLVSSSLIVIIFVFILAGCATTLAPNYDKALVEGLTKNNTEVMAFFASVYGGTKNSTFNEREEKYAKLIGSFNALQIQANARPVPDNKITEKINDALGKRGVPELDDSEIPSATAMTKIAETIVKMRDTDQKQGVTATEVLLFKNQVTIYLDQALTYESFLER